MKTRNLRCPSHGLHDLPRDVPARHTTTLAADRIHRHRRRRRAESGRTSDATPKGIPPKKRICRSFFTTAFCVAGTPKCETDNALRHAPARFDPFFFGRDFARFFFRKPEFFLTRARRSSHRPRALEDKRRPFLAGAAFRPTVPPLPAFFSFRRLVPSSRRSFGAVASPSAPSKIDGFLGRHFLPNVLEGTAGPTARPTESSFCARSTPAFFGNFSTRALPRGGRCPLRLRVPDELGRLLPLRGGGRRIRTFQDRSGPPSTAGS